MKVTVDGTQIHTEKDFHDLIAREFNLPFYGHNLDALWDALTGMIEGPVEMVWLNSELSRQRLENYEKIASILRKAEARDRATGRDQIFTIEFR